MNNRYPPWKKIYLILHHIIPGNGKFGQIFFTKKCNLNCDYCQVAKRKTKDIVLEIWKQIVRRLHRWGVTYISITGGEPTVRKDLEEFIFFLSRLNIFSSLNSNGVLLTTKRIDSLAEAGLCSLIISLDSLGKDDQIKSNSGRVFDLLTHAKKRGIIPQVKAVMNPHNPDAIMPLAEETTRRGLLFSYEILQAVGGLFSKLSRFSPVIKGMAQNQKGLWLPANCFQEATGIGWEWKCNPLIDAWITANNDGTLMVCQEWGSDIPVLSIDNLEDVRWRSHKTATVEECPGCYYECYYSKETTYGRFLAILKELKMLSNALRMLH